MGAYLLFIPGFSSKMWKKKMWIFCYFCTVQGQQLLFQIIYFQSCSMVNKKKANLLYNENRNNFSTIWLYFSWIFDLIKTFSSEFTAIKQQTRMLAIFTVVFFGQGDGYRYLKKHNKERKQFLTAARELLGSGYIVIVTRSKYLYIMDPPKFTK